MGFDPSPSMDYGYDTKFHNLIPNKSIKLPNIMARLYTVFGATAILRKFKIMIYSRIYKRRRCGQSAVRRGHRSRGQTWAVSRGHGDEQRGKHRSYATLGQDASKRVVTW